MPYASIINSAPSVPPTYDAGNSAALPTDNAFADVFAAIQQPAPQADKPPPEKPQPSTSESATPVSTPPSGNKPAAAAASSGKSTAKPAASPAAASIAAKKINKNPLLQSEKARDAASTPASAAASADAVPAALATPTLATPPGNGAKNGAGNSGQEKEKKTNPYPAIAAIPSVDAITPPVLNTPPDSTKTGLTTLLPGAENPPLAGHVAATPVSPDTDSQNGMAALQAAAAQLAAAAADKPGGGNSTATPDKMLANASAVTPVAHLTPKAQPGIRAGAATPPGNAPAIGQKSTGKSGATGTNSNNTGAAPPQNAPASQATKPAASTLNASNAGDAATAPDSTGADSTIPSLAASQPQPDLVNQAGKTNAPLAPPPPLPQQNGAKAEPLVAEANNSATAMYNGNAAVANPSATLTAAQQGSNAFAASPAGQIAVQLLRAGASGSDRFSLQLHPADLGEVAIKLDIGKDGMVHATITASQQSTLDLLQQDHKSLEHTLQQAGLQTNENSLSFNLRGGDGQGGGQEAGQSQQKGQQGQPQPTTKNPWLATTPAVAETILYRMAQGRVNIQV